MQTAQLVRIVSRRWHNSIVRTAPKPVASSNSAADTGGARKPKRYWINVRKRRGRQTSEEGTIVKPGTLLN